MKIGDSFSGALRNFAYFIASGSHCQLEGVEYLDLFGNDPSTIEMAFAIYVNVIEIDGNGIVLNARHAEKRAVDYIRSYCDPEFKVDPPYEDWEMELHDPPPLKDLI